MRPLNASELPTFVERFSRFEDAEFRSTQIISADEIEITLAVQDSARAYDWITITLAFNGVSDARLLEDKKLSLLDMSLGANIIKENNTFAFGLGECYNISSIKNSSCYIISQSLKYKEGPF